MLVSALGGRETFLIEPGRWHSGLLSRFFELFFISAGTFLPFIDLRDPVAEFKINREKMFFFHL
jgi:hypothetical protein